MDSPLFPVDRCYFTLSPRDANGYVLPWEQAVHECQRCGAIVSNRLTHRDWHTSVDSSATIALGGTR